MSSAELKQMGLTRAATRLQRKENNLRVTTFVYVLIGIAGFFLTSWLYGDHLL